MATLNPLPFTSLQTMDPLENSRVRVGAMVLALMKEGPVRLPVSVPPVRGR